MAEENLKDKIDVVLPEDKASEPEIKVVTEEKPTKKAIAPEEGIEELRKKLEDSNSAREKAEREAAEARAMADRAAKEQFAAKNEVHDTNLQLVNNAIYSIKSQQQTMKSDYATALSLQDFEKAAEIQMAMSDAAAKLLTLENGKAQMVNRPKPLPPRPVSKLDAIIADVSKESPASAQWLVRNKEHLNDDRMLNKMFRAHADAVEDGIKPDTPDYFSFIESRLGISSAPKEENDVDATEQAAKTTQRRQAPQVAPTTRAGSSSGARPTVVRLKQEEHDMAQMMGMTDQEYATHKLALQKEGRLN